MSELSDKLNLIWYGDFEDHQNNPCTSFDLTEQSAIKRVYRTDSNLWPTYRYGAANNPFDTLECGYAYIIELESNSSVNIPHANASPNGSAPRGLLVKEVSLTEPTPTPTPVTPVEPEGCIPEEYTTLTDTGSSQIIPGLGTIAFYDPGKFGYKTSDFPEIEGLSRRATINAPDGFTLVDITLQAWPSAGSTPMVYFDCTSQTCAGDCYGGNLEPINGTDNWIANLKLISSNGPTPTPTPTPVVATECGKPDDDSFGTFDLAATAALPQGTSGADKHDTAVDGSSMLQDKGDADYLESIGVPAENLEQATYVVFSPKAAYGEIRGELIYNRKTDFQNLANYDGFTRKTALAYFEDQLPLPTTGPGDVIAACKFTLRKNILIDDDVFLKLDGECYKATIYSDTDNAQAPSGFPVSNFPIVIFRKV